MRMLIASLPIGTGHDIAAQALAEACTQRGISVNFSHDVVENSRVLTKMYFLSLEYFPHLYGNVFKREDVPGRSALWNWHRNRFRHFASRVLTNVYSQYRPDAVICTHPFALSAWSYIKEQHPEMGLIAVLTDLSVHRFWHEPLADAYTIWFPEQVRDLERFGVAKDQIWDTGIPIRASFQEDTVAVPGFRERPIVLLGGGLGLGPYYRILKDLSQLSEPVIAVCGHNEKLRWQLSEKHWPMTMTIAGYVEHMPLLLKESQLVVGKPGGVTAAEVAQSQVPWILTHWIPGQEEINRDRLVEHDMAVRGDDSLLEKVTNLIGTSAQSQAMIAQQKKWARPYAADAIIHNIVELLQTKETNG